MLTLERSGRGRPTSSASSFLYDIQALRDQAIGKRCEPSTLTMAVAMDAQRSPVEHIDGSLDSVLMIAEALPSLHLLELPLAVESVGLASVKDNAPLSLGITMVTGRWALTLRSTRTMTLAKARCAMGDPRRHGAGSWASTRLGRHPMPLQQSVCASTDHACPHVP